MNQEFFDEPATVVTHTDGEGLITPQIVTWRDKHYTITAVGRQWNEPDGRHVLVETADGTRFELQLRREDLVWHMRRVWWASTTA